MEPPRNRNCESTSQQQPYIITNNQVGDEGVIGIAKSIPNRYVSDVSLGSNQIGDKGAIEIAKAIPNSNAIHLYPSDNQIGDKGAIEIAKAIPNSNVTYLNQSDWRQRRDRDCEGIDSKPWTVGTFLDIRKSYGSKRKGSFAGSQKQTSHHGSRLDSGKKSERS